MAQDYSTQEDPSFRATFRKPKDYSTQQDPSFREMFQERGAIVADNPAQDKLSEKARQPLPE